MAQLSARTTAGRTPTAPLPIQQTTSAAGSVWRRIISQVSHIAPHTGKQTRRGKTPEMPILSYYFAFRDRN
jgi:hypothetical protein